VQTTGTQSYAFDVFGAGAALRADNVVANSGGSDAHAIAVRNGGILAVSTSAISASGLNAAGLFFSGPVGVTSTATLSSTTLSSTQGPSFLADGGVSNLALNSSIAVVNNGLWLTAVTSNAGNPTTINAVLASSTVQGAATTDSASTSNVTLQSGALWMLTGSSDLTSLTNGAGSAINFSPPNGGPFKTLTVGNYIGGGGTLGLNTFLSVDSSPSDRLVINGGAASGNSLVRIANAGGLGAVTSGNGILVVDAVNGGTTAPGAFALAGPVSAGPYEYTLHRSSADASNPQDWYLRSQINCALDPEIPYVPNQILSPRIIAQKRLFTRPSPRWPYSTDARYSTHCTNASGKRKICALVAFRRTASSDGLV
jgi:type V secretory pathway adhesin AidA